MSVGDEDVHDHGQTQHAGDDEPGRAERAAVREHETARHDDAREHESGEDAIRDLLQAFEQYDQLRDLDARLEVACRESLRDDLQAMRKPESSCTMISSFRSVTRGFLRLS